MNISAMESLGKLTPGDVYWSYKADNSVHAQMMQYCPELAMLETKVIFSGTQGTTTFLIMFCFASIVY